MDILSKFAVPGAVFVLTLASGIWLSSRGKPLNGILFNLHKLIALGAVILFGLQIYNHLPSAPGQTLLSVLIVLAICSVLVLFASGALMSAGKPAYERMLALHRISPFILVISLALAVYFLTGNNQ